MERKRRRAEEKRAGLRSWTDIERVGNHAAVLKKEEE
jgi:hypothetical protein